jgi:hypothetical protein
VAPPLPSPKPEEPRDPINPDTPISYWLTPVCSDEDGTSDDVIKTLVDEERIYAFGERTPDRKHLRPWDWMVFYATGKGVVAHAKVASVPNKGQNPKIRHPDQYPWLFRLSTPVMYLDEPVVIDSALRSKLETFSGRDPNSPWAWFVQATKKVSEDEFRLLTRKK